MVALVLRREVDAVGEVESERHGEEQQLKRETVKSSGSVRQFRDVPEATTLTGSQFVAISARAPRQASCALYTERESLNICALAS